MDIQIEPLKKCIPEMNAILPLYWDAAEETMGVPPRDMDWDHYIEQERIQQLALITGRVGIDKELVGFVMYIIFMHPHHKTVRYAMCDVIAVKHGYTSTGIGSKIMKAAEPLLKMFYVKRILHGYRVVAGVEPLFPKLGYTLYEQAYLKVI